MVKENVGKKICLTERYLQNIILGSPIINNDTLTTLNKYIIDRANL